MRKASLLLVSLVAITLASCVSTVPVKLPLPPALVLPKISASELECLSDSTYSTLVERDALQAERIKTLEGIIRTTH